MMEQFDNEEASLQRMREESVRMKQSNKVSQRKNHPI